MYRIVINGITDKYEYEELAKVFLNPKDFVMICGAEGSAGDIIIDANEIRLSLSDEKTVKNRIKHNLYQELSKLTEKSPDWGILTGVRPVKLAGELVGKLGRAEAKRLLLQDYLLSPEKAELILDTYAFQQQAIGRPPDRSAGVYIGIPFCPTRCLYCSFTSNQKGPEEIARYLSALHREVAYVGEKMRERSYTAESIYMGGGTPTTLSAGEMDELLSLVRKVFDLSKLREFTVEAGRPDTITEEKLNVLLSQEIGRISINPQSMKAKTLEIIGRAHSPGDTRAAMKLARKVGIPVINMDVIAGLPEETPEDFKATLSELTDYGAENITVHTLAVKRASRLIEQDPDFHYRQALTVREMLAIADDMLRRAGYRPYYLYRQKHMAGSFENIGWCLPGTESVYNIRIMEEAQTIAATGAGGISKQFYPAENRLERVANVSNYEIYIDRLDEMIERKENILFK